MGNIISIFFPSGPAAVQADPQTKEQKTEEAAQQPQKSVAGIEPPPKEPTPEPVKVPTPDPPREPTPDPVKIPTP